MKIRNKFGVSVMAFGLFIVSFQAMAQELTVAPAHLVCDYGVSEKVDTQVK